ncbi:MAG: hypothetical protein IPM89_03790 [Candidatus Competibacteraceae bacterium]|nr:MAG: hypothetical protein IPM89_03790 [Candidatus Competibacteraceae bacterium]
MFVGVLAALYGFDAVRWNSHGVGRVGDGVASTGEVVCGFSFYTQGATHAQQVLNAINPELQQLRQYGGIRPGPAPTTRESGHAETEIPMGGSGFVWSRWYEEGDQD